LLPSIRGNESHPTSSSLLFQLRWHGLVCPNTFTVDRLASLDGHLHRYLRGRQLDGPWTRAQTCLATNVFIHAIGLPVRLRLHSRLHAPASLSPASASSRCHLIVGFIATATRHLHGWVARPSLSRPAPSLAQGRCTPGCEASRSRGGTSPLCITIGFTKVFVQGTQHACPPDCLQALHAVAFSRVLTRLRISRLCSWA
jgi:hypothetical protein